MEPSTLQGNFWRADKPDHKVAGTLRFGGSDPAELSLIGSLDPSQLMGNQDRDLIRIIGNAENKALTLDGCFPTSNRFYSGSGVHERYYVRTILSGAEFSDSEPLEFVGANLFVQHLREWGGLRTVAIDKSIFSGKNGAITYTNPPSASVRTDFGELELWGSFTLHPERFKTSIEQIYGFAIRLTEAQPLTSVMQLGSALQDLLTICANRTVAITGFSLHHSDLAIESASGETKYHPIELHVQHRGNHALSDTREVLGPEMLVSFDGLGGIDGIGRWLDCAAKYKGTLAALLSHRYIPRMYTDNRFGNILTAAEALSRVRSGKQHIKLRPSLESLADEAGEPFRAIVLDVGSWAKRVVDTRVLNVVHRGLHENDSPNLYALSESVYFLVVMCLLREVGVDSDTLCRIQRSQECQWLSRQLQPDR